jgi:hypothetical protein
MTQPLPALDRLLSHLVVGGLNARNDLNARYGRETLDDALAQVLILQDFMGYVSITEKGRERFNGRGLIRRDAPLKVSVPQKVIQKPVAAKSIKPNIVTTRKQAITRPVVQKIKTPRVSKPKPVKAPKPPKPPVAPRVQVVKPIVVKVPKPVVVKVPKPVKIPKPRVSPNLKYHFTPEMDEHLRRTWTGTTGHARAGVTIALAEQWNMPDYTVRQRAQSLGLTQARQGTSWTDRELETLRKAIDLGATVPMIAIVLERVEPSVNMKRKALKLARKRYPRGTEHEFPGMPTLQQIKNIHETGEPGEARLEDVLEPGDMWTIAEIEFLKANVGVLELQAIADRLKRSVRSIEHKCHFYGISPSHRPGMLTLEHVIRETNTSKQIIYRARDKGDLPAERAKTEKGMIWLFSEADVAKWKVLLEQNNYETDANRSELIRRTWLTVKQYANAARHDVEWVYTRIKNGELESRKINQIGKSGAPALYVNPTGQPLEVASVESLGSAGKEETKALERRLLPQLSHLLDPLEPQVRARLVGQLYARYWGQK